MNDEQLELLDDQHLLDFDAGREEAEPVLEPELLTIQLFKQAIRESVGNADSLQAQQLKGAYSLSGLTLVAKQKVKIQYVGIMLEINRFLLTYSMVFSQPTVFSDT
jgi:hypothetical protein